ncbi:hypothetical protein CRUP_036908 [Coryphaenoides rupestris]|nr:hypothetical protein CRUP_036908 [Coryphaenoides rupestris]
MRKATMDEAFDPLKCNEELPSSPGCTMDFDDMPELQEVDEDRQSSEMYQVEVGVSHQELCTAASSPPATNNWLAELANIATSPQSPLLKDAPHKSESESGVFSMSSSFSDDEDMAWSRSWPSTAWHCFLKGTRLRFHRGANVEWQDADDLRDSDDDSDDESMMVCTSLKSYGAEGLRLVDHEESMSVAQVVLKLTFDPGSSIGGWSSFYPSLTVVHHGIPCYEMQVGDLCLPPNHPEAINCDDSVVFDTFRSYDFTPLDSSAVYVLSNMARQRRTSQSSGGAVSPDCDKFERSGSPQSSHGKSSRSQAQVAASTVTPTKCKRPMNAFMLFAKKYRVEYTQMYPGKDNRAISVILGDKWKKMKSEERRMYTLEAKALAEEQKRLNPDCWKRKRTNSVRTTTTTTTTLYWCFTYRDTLP